MHNGDNMIEQKTSTWQRWFRREPADVQPAPPPEAKDSPNGDVRSLEIPTNDPLLAYVHNSPGIIEVDKLKLDSPTLRDLQEAGVKLSLPLVSQGELIGLLNLGSRLSEQEYSRDDFRLLQDLATQASPALRVAQLAQRQKLEARQRERLEQELRVARIIQETLLPREIPSITGFELAVHWQPAQEVGGDFYDFIQLPEDRLGIIIADVTDKGIPAAMVMATTRSLLRSAAENFESPGQVLARANDLLYPDIPAKMFVTCLYLILNSATGHIRFANAGHNLPYLRTKDGVIEARATGMPLGLMQGMDYEENEVTLAPGQRLLLSSDGLVEAHNPNRKIFGFPRVKEIMAEEHNNSGLIEILLDELEKFTGDDYEQEDDITLLTIEHSSSPESPSMGDKVVQKSEDKEEESITISQFSFPSQPGGERQAAIQVLESLQGIDLTEARRKRLETAVAEATLNAMEHGNHYQEDLPVEIRVFTSQDSLVVRIKDQGVGTSIPDSTQPDLDAKLAGEQSPRGWGLYLIKNMVDELHTTQDETHHIVDLIINLV
jgi:serine phosphatase RsbU (regulator of sigma subunit)/anti-sigma regulatory factor (Ser/Thr protein kinase)